MAENRADPEAMSFQVAVLDSYRQFVEYVSPAVARHALKMDRARVFIRDPFTIQLHPGVSRAPRPWDNLEVVRIERQMQTKSWKQMLPSERAKAISEFFKVERDNVWLKVLGDAQIVLNIKDGKDPIQVPPVVPGDPFLVTKYVDYGLLRRATGDFRDFIMKGYIKLMSQEEAQEWFEKKAARVGRSVDDLMVEAELRANVVERAGMRVEDSPVRARVADKKMPEEEPTPGFNPALIKDVVKPRVQHLCRQGSVQMTPENRKPARDLQEDFIAIEDSLSEDDLQYILANMSNQGEYQSIRKWAEDRLGQIG